MEEQPQSARDGGGDSGHQGTVDPIHQKPRDHRIIPVWFFVGIILLVYGIIIFITGLMEFAHPPATVLSQLHPAIWWGALLVVLGGIYVYLHFPRKH